MALQRIRLAQRCIFHHHVSFAYAKVQAEDNFANSKPSCYAAANNDIFYDATTKATRVKKIGPIKTFTGVPPDEFQQQAPGFAGQFNAIDTMVYAYSGALLFVAFLAEMRHPLDFWKGIFLAQAFICFVYLFFGAFVSPLAAAQTDSTLIANNFLRSTPNTASTPPPTSVRSCSRTACKPSATSWA